MPCPQCYETDAVICPKAANPAAVCTGFCSNPLGQRTGHGEYPASLRSTLPPSVSAADSGHLDSLLGHVAAPLAAVALTADEQAIVDDATMAGLIDNNLNLAVTIVQKRPNLRSTVEARLDIIANTANQVVTARLAHVATRIQAVCDDIKEKAKETKPGTGTAYKQATYPQATLFQTIVKACVKGQELPEESKAMFDPTTGKTYVPFGGSVKVDTTTQLIYCAHTFVTSMLTIKNEAPKVYYEFMRDVARVADDKGARFAQEYIDILLRFLDEKRFPSMVALYKTGEPTRTFTELSMRKESDSSRGRGNTRDWERLRRPGGLIESPSGEKVPYGPVTKPMGGEGAAWFARKCNRFHGDPRKPCTAGIPAGFGFPEKIVGLCAYEH